MYLFALLITTQFRVINPKQHYMGVESLSNVYDYLSAKNKWIVHLATSKTWKDAEL